MPSFDYDKMHDVAEKLLLKFGDTGVLTKKTFTVADDTKPWERGSTDSTIDITMCLVPWSKRDIDRYFGEDIIASTQKGLVLYDSSAQIENDATITYQGETFTISAFKQIKPASTGILYICALSGGAL